MVGPSEANHPYATVCLLEAYNMQTVFQIAYCLPAVLAVPEDRANNR